MIAANHAQTCSCGQQIEPDDRIGKVDGEWVCATCVEDAGGEDPPRRQPRRDRRRP
jgi:hypothetical protein